MRSSRLAMITVFVTVIVTSAHSVASSIDQTLAQMTLKQKVGQLVMFGIADTRLTLSERDLIRRHHLGGVILFSKNYSSRVQLTELTDQIQRVARNGSGHRIGALISADQEGGVVKRFSDMPPWHSAPEMGASGNPALAYSEGRATGRALRGAGINVNLAPVADLDLPPGHVMRSRSFGSRPRPVGLMVRAFGSGLQDRRVAATPKHFPGLGGASINSDYGPAYVRRTKRQLRRVDAIPFHKAVEGGARMMMVSHGIYVYDGGNRPASLNHHIATERLRREFDFHGVSISDALGPVSWKFDGDIPRTCKATIRAGVDIALITENASMARECVRAIRDAVRSGEMPLARINKAVRRVLQLKTWLGAFDPSRG